MALRLSEAQYRRLQQGQQESTAKPAKFRLTAAKPRVSENDVERQIRDFLVYRGWTVVRQQSGLFRRLNDEGRVRVGEKGCADWYAVRPATDDSTWPPCAHFFYYEVKAARKKPSQDQLAWIMRQRTVGLLAGWFDSLDSFTDFYRQVFRT